MKTQVQISGLSQWVKNPALPWAVVLVADMAQILHYCGCGIGPSCNSDLTPSLGTSICHEYGPKKTKKNFKKFWHAILTYATGVATPDLNPLCGLRIKLTTLQGPKPLWSDLNPLHHREKSKKFIFYFICFICLLIAKKLYCWIHLLYYKYIMYIINPKRDLF